MRSKFIAVTSLTLILTGIRLQARLDILVGSGKSAPVSSEEQPVDRWHTERAREHKVEILDGDKPTLSAPSAPGTPVSPKPLPPSAPGTVPTAKNTPVGASSTPSDDRRIIVRSWERELYLKQQQEKKDGSITDDAPEETPQSPPAEKPKAEATEKTTGEPPAKDAVTPPVTVSTFFSPVEETPTIINHPHRRF